MWIIRRRKFKSSLNLKKFAKNFRWTELLRSVRPYGPALYHMVQGYLKMIKKAITAAITTPPKNKTLGAGLMSISPRTGITLGSLRGITAVMTPIARTTAPKVIAILLRKAMLLYCHCKKPYTGTQNNSAVTPAAAGAGQHSR